MGFGPGKILSLPDALARTLAEHLGQIKPDDLAGGRGGNRQANRRSLQGVRAGDVRLRGGVQEVSLLRLQRMLTRWEPA